MFNVFGVSSSLGASIWKIASKMKVDLKEIRKENKISKTFLIPAMRPVSEYGITYTKVPERFKNIEVLTKELKSTSPITGLEFGINLGHYGYIEIFDNYKKDSLYLIKNNLKLYFQNVIKALVLFFQPSWEHGWGIRNNQHTLKSYIDYFGLNTLRLKIENFFYNNKRPWPLKSNVPVSSYIIILLFYIYVCAKTGASIVKAIREKNISKELFLSLFIVGNILYITLVSNLIELSENDRYRVMLDPLVLILFVYFISKKYKCLRAKNL